MYILLLVFLANVPASLSIVALALVSTPSISTTLLNFFTRLAPVSKYNELEFFIFNSSILLRVNNTSEYSLVLSVAPDKDIYELLIVTIEALWIEIFLLISVGVP